MNTTMINQTQKAVTTIIEKLSELISSYSSNPDDAFADGNVAVCIIDEDGNTYGKIWGTDRVKGRGFARMAWIKATQVWITGMRTGGSQKALPYQIFRHCQ
jgi:hypothetical protein